MTTPSTIPSPAQPQPHPHPHPQPQPQSQPQSPSTFARWVPSLPTVNFNSLNPFTASDSTNPKSTPAASTNDDFQSRHVSPSRSNTMFAEPTSTTVSEAGDSREGSMAEERARKRCNKAKTSYSVCHPPPSNAGMTRHKLHRRPRSLLQLHRIQPNARPIPAFEVIPSANFSVRLIKSITKVFKARHGLCPNDLVVLRAEKYASVDVDVDEEQETRDIIGLICNRRKETKEEGTVEKAKVKICLASGAEWEAYSLMNGGYEFFTTDEHGLGLTMRWWPKKNKDGSKALSKDGSRRFNFSTISPNSRRHPVMAVLSKSGVDIYDTYKMPDPNATTPNATPKRNSNNALTDAMEDEGIVGCDMCETDDALRELISMTAIWVTFKEGWSPTFQYDDADKAPTRAASGMSAPYSPTKPASASASTLPGIAQLEKRGSIRSVGSSIMRRTSMLNRENRTSQVSVPEGVEAEISSPDRSTSIQQKTGRARGDSTSTVLVHRAASNRRNKNNSAATWRPDMVAAQNALNEVSREDVNTTPQKVTVLSPSIWDSPADTPLVAQPLIPPPAADSVPASPSQAPRQVVTEKPPVEKRISDATTEVSSSSRGSVAQREAVTRVGGKTREKGKRKSGWRKLFCGVGGSGRNRV
ncbi:hypothetical protein LTR62_008668 [Meristemomyces frigidus]|uniref:Uncharacterized protein n=1 Tax=Meristemomyces frigidus TaxID=1508187 RepID=A0AAN7TAG8_9PEZI|nr:hypothetical protein LTR62_008668 [Meristemomyces frigidus]